MPAVILTEEQRQECALDDGDSSSDQIKVNVKENNLKTYQKPVIEQIDEENSKVDSPEPSEIKIKEVNKQVEESKIGEYGKNEQMEDLIQQIQMMQNQAERLTNELFS